VPNLSVVASLAALFVISQSTISMAASANQKANASYASSNSSQMSRAQQEPVPANCVRQECGKLWCWQMNGSKSH
jgi:multidrug resistance efflux pump